MAGVVFSEPSTFKASVAAGMMKFLKGRKILDFCAGWGDRLLGAIATEHSSDVRCHPMRSEFHRNSPEISQEFGYYVGVDPNATLTSGYNKMINSLARDPSK